MSVDNVQALLPFLILYHGYNDNHESNPILPFEGWKDGFGQIIGYSLIDSCLTLSDRLGQESKSVVNKGYLKLFYFISVRWCRWARRSSEEEQDEYLKWRLAFEGLVYEMEWKGHRPNPRLTNPRMP